MTDCCLALYFQLPVNCLICNQPALETEIRISQDQLAMLWRSCGKNLDDALKAEVRGRSVVLFECSKCGFRFFDPTLAGSGEFYEALHDPTYYCAKKAEFDAAIKTARTKGMRRILDVGCGNGAFLDQAKAAGLETWGTEIHIEAAAEAERKGHKIVRGLLSSIPAGEKFQMITLFQVLEHVPNPKGLLLEAASYLPEGGLLFIAVPNESAVPGMAALSPYQLPPHHITRWRVRDLESLAEGIGFKVIVKGADSLLSSELRHYWRLRSETRKTLGLPTSKMATGLVWLVSFVYKGLTTIGIRVRRGHSVWVALQKR